MKRARGRWWSIGFEWTEQVPAIADNVQEDDDAAVGLFTGLTEEPDAGGAHARVGRVEVIDPQEHAHAPGELVSHGRGLMFAISAREQNATLGTGRPNDDPALRMAMVSAYRRGVFDQAVAQCRGAG